MSNIAIIGICDFENWNTEKSISMGGASGVIKSILPYIIAEKIYLFGITSNKTKLNTEIALTDKVTTVPIVYIPENSRVPNRILALLYGRNINYYLKKYNISSIYSHSEEIAYWIKPGYKILYHMHGSTNALAKAKNKLFRKKILQQLWEYVRKISLKKAFKVIAIDTLCYDLAKINNRENDTILIPNFVDKSIFYKDSAKSNLLKDIQEKIVLFVGKIEEVKGLELFIDVVNELNRRNKGKWKGVLVGRGTYRQTIAKYIKERSDTKDFVFLGAIFEQSELRKIYSQSLVLIISSFHEGIPMVILEALACETYVISTNVGGIKSLVSDAKKCFVIDERDPSLFADQIKKIEESRLLSKVPFKFSAKEASIVINEILTA